MPNEIVEIQKRRFDCVDPFHYSMAVFWSQKFGLLAYGTTAFLGGCTIGGLITYFTVTW